jgi:hypothetical protein
MYSTVHFTENWTNFPRNVGDACCDALTLQMHYKENSKQIFPELKLCSLVPNFYIHVSVSDLYIPTIGLPILLYCICGPIVGRYV